MSVRIVKRNGESVEFLKEKVDRVVSLALGETNETIEWSQYERLLDDVCAEVKDGMSVEDVSNLIEKMMMKYGLYETSKRFILFRAERTSARNKPHPYKYLSREFLSKYKHLDEPFNFEIGKFTYLRTYSRSIPEEKRREYWWETVARVVDYNVGLAKWKTELDAKNEAEKLFDNIYNLRQFPSGRALFSGGTKTSYTNPISQFNCSFKVFDTFDIVREMTYLLMLGVGFGFSVEKQYVEHLPPVRGDIRVLHKEYSPVSKSSRKEATEFYIDDDIMEITVGDSKFGWSNALDLFIKSFYQLDFAHIKVLVINYDNIRPFNEPLKTFGGFASGHTALQTMIDKIYHVITKNNKGKKRLKPIECMDIANIVAEGIVVGGTRRSAESSMISHDDKETQEAKMNLYTQDENGNWVVNQEIIHRMMSNNNTAYWFKPTYEELKERFKIIKHSAENNFFNMEAAVKRRPVAKGTNPLTV